MNQTKKTMFRSKHTDVQQHATWRFPNSFLVGVGVVATVMMPLRAGAAPPRVNILFIMSDDHAKNALSCYGNTDIHVDLAPTLLDFAGLPIPEDMQGHSLKVLLQHPSVLH